MVHMHKYAKGLHAATQRYSTPIPSFDLSLIPIPYSPDCPERPRRVQPELPDIRVRVQTDFSRLVPRNRLECPTRRMLLCLRRALDSCSYYPRREAVPLRRCTQCATEVREGWRTEEEAEGWLKG